MMSREFATGAAVGLVRRVAGIQAMIEVGHAQSVGHASFKWRVGEFSLPDESLTGWRQGGGAVIVRRSFSDVCRDGDLSAIVRDIFAIRRRGQLIDVPFHRLPGTEVIELAEALHVAADLAPIGSKWRAV